MQIWMCPKCRNSYKIKGNEKKITCVCGERYCPGLPTLPKRLWNFTHAIYKHWINGMPTCTDAQVQSRLDTCMQCHLFTGTHCSHEACGCNVNGEVKFLNKLAWADQHCPEYKWDRIKPRWITTAQLSKDILTLVTKLPEDLVAIVGVARSGLVVGSQIASYLHLPLYSLDIFTEELVRCGSGYRLKDHKEAEGKYLVVDDTVTTYQTMSAVKEVFTKFNKPFITGTVYVTPGNEDKVDYFVDQLAPPHYLEWSFFNNHFNDVTSFDMDGVICEDVEYATFIEKLDDLAPKHLPRYKPITIITGRPESLRERTLIWLTKYGVKVKELIMSNCVHDITSIAKFKAEQIKSKIYVESCMEQAKIIKKMRPELTVICLDRGVVL